jgi:2-oxoacid:acceptor oxidoreductase gamma subunit (pyruvate/2-ketoisovalerate family)
LYYDDWFYINVEWWCFSYDTILRGKPVAVVEIRIHGRGGQGAVIASKIIALSFFYDGYEVQSFPAFGIERRGAPVSAYARADRKPILLRSEIYNPDHVIVLDRNLMESVDVLSGLSEGGTLLVNSATGPLHADTGSLYRTGYVDASGIAASRGLGSSLSPIINTSIVGAFAGFTGLVQMESVERAIREETPTKQEENIAAAREAYGKVKLLNTV